MDLSPNRTRLCGPCIAAIAGYVKHLLSFKNNIVAPWSSGESGSVMV